MQIVGNFLSRHERVLFVVLIVLTVGLSGGGCVWNTYYAHADEAATTTYITPEEADQYVRFEMEVFDIITREYWQKVEEAKLAELFRLSLGKAENKEEKLETNDRVGVAKMIAAAVRATTDDKRQGLVSDTAIDVLANLVPLGRSGLLSEKQEKEFRDNANNVDRSHDLYATLDVPAGSGTDIVAKAADEKKAELEKQNTPEAAAQIKEVEHAKEVLADAHTKAIYDETKIEPTVLKKVLNTSVLYFDMSKVSPATFDEFLQTFQNIDKQPQITSLIIDMRGNVGGTLDFAKYFVALFIGPNQYAFDLWHQEQMNVERTPQVPKIAGLDRIKEMAILTDNMTQSTAELTTAILKRLHLAKVIGTPTRGWGSVENTFPIATQLGDTKYSILLVHSLTLGDDNQPIEERGVTPNVDIRDANWKQKLSGEFNSSNLIQAVTAVLSKTK